MAGRFEGGRPKFMGLPLGLWALGKYGHGPKCELGKTEENRR